MIKKIFKLFKKKKKSQTKVKKEFKKNKKAGVINLSPKKIIKFKQVLMKQGKWIILLKNW